MERTQFLEVNLSRQLEWIRAADTRIALVLPLATTMLGVLAILSPKPTAWPFLAAIASSFAAFFLVMSLTFSAFAAFPRTKGPKGSLIYFDGIISRDVGQYANDVSEIDEATYFQDLASQVHVNAQIAGRKFFWVTRSMACLFISALPWLIGVYELYRG